MVGRFTPEWFAWAKTKIAADRAALAASTTPEQLVQHDAEERRRLDAVWGDPAHLEDTSTDPEEHDQDELEQRVLAALGEEGIAYLRAPREKDFELSL